MVRDALFYFTAFLLGSIFGMLASYVRNKHEPFIDILAIGFTGGFIATATIGFLLRSIGAGAGDEPYYLSIAVFVGASGKMGLSLANYAVNQLFKKFVGFENESGNNET